MSLPEYQKLLAEDRGDDIDLEAQSGSYPPLRDVTSRRVVYTYLPIYPRKGDLQHVVGTIGRDHEETKDFVQEYFPSLAEIPRDRIIIKMPVNTSPITASAATPSGSQATPAPQTNRMEDWASLTSHTWMTFGSDPPERLAVFVEDTEADARARFWYRDLILLYLMLAGLSVFPLVGLVMWLFG